MLERCRRISMNRAVSRAVEIGFASTEARTTLLHHGKGPAAKKVSGYCQRMDLLNVKYCQQSPRQNVGWAVSVVKPESKYWLQREKWNRSICSLASSASLSPSICWSSSSKPSQLKKRPSRKLGNDQGRQRGQHIPRRTYKSQSSAEHCSTLPLGVFQLLVDLTGHKDKVDKVLRELTFFSICHLSPLFEPRPNIFAFWGYWNAHTHSSGRQELIEKKWNQIQPSFLCAQQVSLLGGKWRERAITCYDMW